MRNIYRTSLSNRSRITYMRLHSPGGFTRWAWGISTFDFALLRFAWNETQTVSKSKSNQRYLWSYCAICFNVVYHSELSNTSLPARKIQLITKTLPQDSKAVLKMVYLAKQQPLWFNQHQTSKSKYLVYISQVWGDRSTSIQNKSLNSTMRRQASTKMAPPMWLYVTSEEVRLILSVPTGYTICHITNIHLVQSITEYKEHTTRERESMRTTTCGEGRGMHTATTSFKHTPYIV